jgi:hypothetical protein
MHFMSGRSIRQALIEGATASPSALVSRSLDLPEPTQCGGSEECAQEIIDYVNERAQLSAWRRMH